MQRRTQTQHRQFYVHKNWLQFITLSPRRSSVRQQLMDGAGHFALQLFEILDSRVQFQGQRSRLGHTLGHVVCLKNKQPSVSSQEPNFEGTMKMDRMAPHILPKFCSLAAYRKRVACCGARRSRAQYWIDSNRTSSPNSCTLRN